MKIISEKKITDIYKEHSWLIFSHELYRLKTLAQAQLEADKKDHELSMATQAGYLELKRRAEIRKLFEEIGEMVSQEPELEGDMPEDLWSELQDREGATIVLRAIVRITKKNMAKNLQALKERYTK